MVSRHENNTQRIAALDERAEALGLKPGTGIADARAMHPHVEVVEDDPQADRRLLDGLADWCDRYTPLVALDGADGLFLDITGCAHLFGGEKAMLQDVLSKLFQQGFSVRAGLASTAGAAWAAARFSGAAIVERGAEAELLGPLPLAALRLAPAQAAGLESVGLDTAGALISLPRAPLARRFGKTLLIRLDQALGREEEALSPRLPVPALSVERHLAEPVLDLESIEQLVAGLAATLQADMEEKSIGARRLELALFRVDGHVWRLAVGAARPLRAPARIKALFHEKLAAAEAAFDAGYGFDLVRLSVLVAAALDARQTDLGDPPDDAGDSLAVFADRLRARLGETALLSPALVESHLPERAARTVPYEEGHAAAAGARHRADRLPRPSAR